MRQTPTTNKLKDHPYVKNLLEVEGFSILEFLEAATMVDLVMGNHTSNDLPDEEKSSELVCLYYIDDDSLPEEIMEALLCLCATSIFPSGLVGPGKLCLSHKLPIKNESVYCY